jgi:hypothetical protein
MLIAGALSGDPRRYVELLAANPQKPLTFVGGCPTFRSLAVGERLFVPLGFAGDSLCRAFGVGSHQEAFARLQHVFGVGATPESAFDRLARRFGTGDVGDVGAWEPGGSRLTGMTKIHGLEGLNETRTNATAYALGLGDIGLADIFGDIGHAVGNAVHDIGNAAGHLPQDVAKVAQNAANEAQKAVNSVGKFIKQAGGDVGKWLQDAANNFVKDPMGTLAKIATSGPLGLILNPDALLKQLGIPTPGDMLHKLGLPDPGELLKKAGLPTNPADLVRGIAHPKELLEKIPGIKEIAKFIPNIDPLKMVTGIVDAAVHGDWNRLKTEVVDLGHMVAGVLSMVPGVGNVIGGPLDAAITLLETGNPLKAGFSLLIGEVPGIPPDIRDIFLRPALNAVADIIEKHESVSDALVSGIKDGIMGEAKSKGLPDSLLKLIGNLLDGAIQLIFHHKPLSQVATGFLQQGLQTAISAAGASIKLPPEITKPVDDLKKAFEDAKSTALQKFGDLTKIPAEVQHNIDAIKGQYEGAFKNVMSKLPPDVSAKLTSIKDAAHDFNGLGAKVNNLSALTNGIIKLNKLDPKKLDAGIQKQISDLKAALQANKLGIQAHAKSLDNNLGARAPNAPVQHAAVVPAPATPPAPAVVQPPAPSSPAVAPPPRPPIPPMPPQHQHHHHGHPHWTPYPYAHGWPYAANR